MSAAGHPAGRRFRLRRISLEGLSRPKQILGFIAIVVVVLLLSQLFSVITGDNGDDGPVPQEPTTSTALRLVGNPRALATPKNDEGRPYSEVTTAKQGVKKFKNGRVGKAKKNITYTKKAKKKSYGRSSGPRIR